MVKTNILLALVLVVLVIAQFVYLSRQEEYQAQQRLELFQLRQQLQNYEERITALETGLRQQQGELVAPGLSLPDSNPEEKSLAESFESFLHSADRELQRAKEALESVLERGFGPQDPGPDSDGATPEDEERFGEPL